ncbi:MAG TPA: ribosome maturation factor RimM [Burkholderiaceae bacterium]|nr:ribosome maturation factor RimM [Burkholderiaceae bacterium]
MSVPDDLVELGAVTGSYGVRGWVKVRPFGDGEVLRAARTWWLVRQPQRPPHPPPNSEADGRQQAAQQVTVQACRRHSGTLIAKWSGWDKPEAIEALRGAVVLVARADFPALKEGEFYWVDLIGAQVVNRAGVNLGCVSGLRNNGAQDLLEVQGDQAAPLLIPLIPQYVDEVDVAARNVRVDWELDWSQ